MEPTHRRLLDDCANYIENQRFHPALWQQPESVSSLLITLLDQDLRESDDDEREWHSPVSILIRGLARDLEIAADMTLLHDRTVGSSELETLWEQGLLSEEQSRDFYSLLTEAARSLQMTTQEVMSVGPSYWPEELAGRLERLMKSIDPEATYLALKERGKSLGSLERLLDDIETLQVSVRLQEEFLREIGAHVEEHMGTDIELLPRRWFSHHNVEYMNEHGRWLTTGSNWPRVQLFERLGSMGQLVTGTPPLGDLVDRALRAWYDISIPWLAGFLADPKALESALQQVEGSQWARFSGELNRDEPFHRRLVGVAARVALLLFKLWNVEIPYSSDARIPNPLPFEIRGFLNVVGQKLVSEERDSHAGERLRRRVPLETSFLVLGQPLKGLRWGVPQSDLDDDERQAFLSNPHLSLDKGSGEVIERYPTWGSVEGIWDDAFGNVYLQQVASIAVIQAAAHAFEDANKILDRQFWTGLETPFHLDFHPMLTVHGIPRETAIKVLFLGRLNLAASVMRFVDQEHPELSSGHALEQDDVADMIEASQFLWERFLPERDRQMNIEAGLRRAVEADHPLQPAEALFGDKPLFSLSELEIIERSSLCSPA